MSSLIPSKREILSSDGPDRLLSFFAEFFDDSQVKAAVTELRTRIIDSLLNYGVTLEGIEYPGGRFVREGIEGRVAKAREDLNALCIEMTGGRVELRDDQGRIAIGRMLIPWDSIWARQSFINTNPLGGVEQYTFVPERTMEYINPKTVTNDSKGAFLLTDRQAIAAQVLMVVQAAINYRDMTRSAIRESQEDFEYGTPKVEANSQDLRSAMEYAVELREMLREMPKDVDGGSDMIATLSKFSREQKLLS